MATQSKAEQVAVHILESILKRQRYGAQVLEDVAWAIERAGFIASDEAPNGPDYRARVQECESEIATLKAQLQASRSSQDMHRVLTELREENAQLRATNAELRKAKKPKPKAQPEYDSDYYRGVAERNGAKIAAIKKILSQ